MSLTDKESPERQSIVLCAAVPSSQVIFIGTGNATGSGLACQFVRGVARKEIGDANCGRFFELPEVLSKV